MILAFIIILALPAVLLSYWQEDKNSKICFKNNCYFAEIVRTQAEKEKGLMYRKNLDKKQGMLFINNEEKIYPFWMKNMRFPLDIIWLDNNLEVVFVAKNAQPCGEGECNNIIPNKPARYILEINSGEADRIGLKQGDRFHYETRFQKIFEN